MKQDLGNPPLAFFGLVFAVSLPFYLLGVLQPQLGRWMPAGLPVSALMFVVPALAAIWLVQRESRWKGVKTLLGRIGDGGRIANKGWLILSLVLMPATMLISYMVQRMLGQRLPELSGSILAFLFTFAVYFFGAIGEELGWMGYAIDPLQQRYGFWVASIGLGLGWWLWHVIPYHVLGWSVEWILWQGLATLMFRILMVWIYNHAGKSVLTSIVFHAMINTTIAFFPQNGSSYDPMVTGLVLLGMVLWVAWQASSLGSSVQSKSSGKPYP